MTFERAAAAGKIKPLTKRKGTGELYFRRPEVETQINAILSLENKEIFERLPISDRNTKGYLFDETLVYLLREAREESDIEAIETLYEELNRRIWKLLYSFYTKFQKHQDFEDFAQTVEMKMIEKIFDVSTDSADYAQINFGDFVITQARSNFKSKIKRINEEKDFIEIDRPNEDGHDFQLESNEISVEEKQVLKKAINELPDNIRDVAILHYLEGWQIESKDGNEPTICKLYNVSSRTIRNWLKEARRLLADHQGVGR